MRYSSITAQRFERGTQLFLLFLLSPCYRKFSFNFLCGGKSLNHFFRC